MTFVVIVIVLVGLSVLLTLDTTWMNLLQGTRNELVFAERNKKYGAYDLRTDYTRRLVLAMVGALVLFSVVIGTPYVISKMGTEEEAQEKMQIVEVNLDNFREDQPEEPPPPPEVIPPPQPQIETVQFVAVEASNEPVEAPPPTQEDLGETTASTTTQEGQKIDAPPPPPPPPPVEEETFDLAAVQEQPEFPGGMPKMYQYLQQNTKYPDMEFDAGIQGKVYVEFVVAPDGAISQARVVRGVSPGLDKEALRAVRSMPKWNPGKMNGKAVKVRFTIPVDFKLK